jgi:hypothetical protein
MSSTKKYEEFGDFITQPLNQIFKGNYPISKLQQKLKTYYEAIAAEARLNYTELHSKGEEAELYFDGLIEKAKGLKDLIYEDTPDGPYLKVEKIYLKSCGYPEADHSLMIYDKLEDVKKIFKKYYEKSKNEELLSGNEKGFVTKREYNLPRVFDLLKSDGFIAHDEEERIFVRNFTGEKITKKVRWIKSENCLHYFIDGIYGVKPNYGIGVKEEEDGQWKKTIQVFEKKNKSSFSHEQLSHASRKPGKKYLEKLNLIIPLFNRPPKKRLTE